MNGILLVLISMIVALVYLKLETKRREKKHINEIKEMLRSVRREEKNYPVKIEVKKDYSLTIDRILQKEETIKKTMEEINTYKQELNLTYKSLLAKSTELEYSNNLLEKRVVNLSNLNAVGNSVLSELDLDKIISIILDAYFVLTGAKKIALYLWEKGELVNKAFKGNLNLTRIKDKNYENIEVLKGGELTEKYREIAAGIKEKDEAAIISELKVKGKELGAIFIIEELKTGNIKSEEMETISALAIHVAIAINNAKMYAQISVKERISKEVAIAAQIQKNLLPKDIKSAFGLEIANYFEPAKEIGGDYYDYFISAEGRFGVAIGDVSGKGVPAALLMTLIRAVLRTLSFSSLLPDSALTQLNDIIYEDINDEMFVTLFYSLYEFETSTLYYSNAGHNPLMIYNSKDDVIYEKNVKGAAVGFIENYEYRLGKIKLAYNDILVYYTDGINEAENAVKEMFGLEKFKEVIYKYKEGSAELIKDKILEEVFKFRGDYEQVDDITLVVIKHKR